MRKVMDAATRTWHWLFAACFVGAYLTAESEKLRLFHVTLGYTLAGLAVYRLVWGVLGPRHVKLDSVLRKLKGWVTFKQACQDGRGMNSANAKLLVNLCMTSVALLMLLVIVPITASGYLTYNDMAGHWLEEVHEFFGEFMLYLVFAHLALIVIASVLRKTNLANAMLTGFQPGTGPDLVKKDHRLIAGALMMSVVAWTIMYLFVVH